MLELNAHPNTRAIIEAWKRLSRGETLQADGPTTDEYPDLVGRLFILQRAGHTDYSFRVAGAGLEDLFGRELAEHNFLTLWHAHDKPLVAASIDAALNARSPSLVQADGVSLDGRAVKVEVSFAPLDDVNAARPRVLGLYQTLSDEGKLSGRPVWRHFTTGIFPPTPRRELAQVRLVASNDM